MNSGMPLRALVGLLLGALLLGIGTLVCIEAVKAPGGRLWMLPPALFPGVLTLGLTFLVLRKSQ